jgi:hypothetical protein
MSDDGYAYRAGLVPDMQDCLHVIKVWEVLANGATASRLP